MTVPIVKGFPHHVLIAHFQDDHLSFRISSCPGPPKCQTYDEATWPDRFTCRCVDPQCDCRDGDHNGCSKYGFWVEPIGPACQCKPITDTCGLADWLGELGEEMITGEFVVAVNADVEWPGDYPVFKITGEHI